jgi:[CysO sulfur-carrier protein]-S-L-cysteine hydrolase
MKLVLPPDLLERIKRELRQAGTREIGGVLVGEHLRDDVFRVSDLSVQRSGGSQSHFTRDVENNRAFIADFFARTGNDYAKFNYIGEWHSHPLFSALPSGKDLGTMQEIVEDPDVGVNFAVLLIVSTRRRGAIELSVSAFRPRASPENVEVEVQDEAKIVRRGWLRRVIDLLRH